MGQGSNAAMTILGFAAPQNWGDVGTLLGAAASMIAAGIAVFAARYAKHQIREARRVQIETLAQQTYSSYLLKAFENPELALGKPSAVEAVGESAYKWYIAYMLNACEGIVTTLPDDPTWESCVKTQLRYHKNYLTENLWFIKNYERLYDPRIVKLIKIVQTEPAAENQSTAGAVSAANDRISGSADIKRSA